MALCSFSFCSPHSPIYLIVLSTSVAAYFLVAAAPPPAIVLRVPVSSSTKRPARSRLSSILLVSGF